MKPNQTEEVMKHIKYATLCMHENQKHLIKGDTVQGQEILQLDALQDHALANAYWKLDGNAFGDQPAPFPESFKYHQWNVVKQRLRMGKKVVQRRICRKAGKCGLRQGTDDDEADWKRNCEDHCQLHVGGYRAH